MDRKELHSNIHLSQFSHMLLGRPVNMTVFDNRVKAINDLTLMVLKQLYTHHQNITDDRTRIFIQEAIRETEKYLPPLLNPEFKNMRYQYDMNAYEFVSTLNKIFAHYTQLNLEINIYLDESRKEECFLKFRANTIHSQAPHAISKRHLAYTGMDITELFSSLSHVDYQYLMSKYEKTSAYSRLTRTHVSHKTLSDSLFAWVIGHYIASDDVVANQKDNYNYVSRNRRLLEGVLEKIVDPKLFTAKSYEEHPVSVLGILGELTVKSFFISIAPMLVDLFIKEEKLKDARSDRDTSDSQEEESSVRSSSMPYGFHPYGFEVGHGQRYGQGRPTAYSRSELMPIGRVNEIDEIDAIDLDVPSNYVPFSERMRMQQRDTLSRTGQVVSFDPPRIHIDSSNLTFTPGQNPIVANMFAAAAELQEDMRYSVYDQNGAQMLAGPLETVMERLAEPAPKGETQPTFELDRHDIVTVDIPHDRVFVYRKETETLSLLPHTVAELVIEAYK